MIIYFVRHSKTNSHTLGLMQGQSNSDYASLSEKGIKDAEKLAKRLCAENFDVCYCSDSRRTKETHKIITELKEINTIFTPNLKEMGMGVLEDNDLECYEEAKKNKINMCDLGVEDKNRYSDRIKHSLNEIVNCGKERVLVIAHYQSINTIINMLELSNNALYINTSSVSIIEIENKMPRIIKLNDTSHKN